MARRFSSEELRALRNDVAIRTVIGSVLELPCKKVEGVFRFLCPLCSEFQTGVHPEENLARCFRCQRNFNTIELVIAARQLDFVSSVKLLQKYLPGNGRSTAVASDDDRLRRNERCSAVESVATVLSRCLTQF
jgi:DNA primase